MEEDQRRYVIRVLNRSTNATSEPAATPGISGISLSDYYLLSTRVRGMGEEFKQQVAVFLKSFLQNLGYARPSLQEACEYWLSQENSPDGFYVKDLSGTYVYVNPAMASILERSPSEVVGLTDHEVYGECQAQILEDSFNKALQGELVHLETERTINKKKKILLEVLVAKRGRDYEPVGIYGICREVDERTGAEVQTELHDSECLSAAMRETIWHCAQVAGTDCSGTSVGRKRQRKGLPGTAYPSAFQTVSRAVRAHKLRCCDRDSRGV